MAKKKRPRKKKAVVQTIEEHDEHADLENKSSNVKRHRKIALQNAKRSGSEDDASESSSDDFISSGAFSMRASPFTSSDPYRSDDELSASEIGKNAVSRQHQLAELRRSAQQERIHSKAHETIQQLEDVLPEPRRSPQQERLHAKANEFIEQLENGLVILDMNESAEDRIVISVIDTMIAEGLLSSSFRQDCIDGLLEVAHNFPQAVGRTFDIVSYSLADVHPIVAFVRLSKPVNFQALDGLATRFIVVSVGEAVEEELANLGEVLLFFMDSDSFIRDALTVSSRRELIDALHSANDLQLSAVATTTVEEKSDLVCTKRFAGGLMRDLRVYKRRVKSDFIDPFRKKAIQRLITTIVFVSVACFTPNVVIGGLLQTLTEENMGIIEMLLAAGLSGIFYGLFSGQPLVIIGGSGPFLIFVRILYQVCESMEYEFLPIYAWSGIWCFLFLLIFVVTDMSALMRYSTRFTNEIFGALIGVIFIQKAGEKLLGPFFEDHLPSEEFEHSARALLILMLGFATYVLNSTFHQMRRSHFLLRTMREVIADFGGIIAIALVTLFFFILVPSIPTAHLVLPNGISPTKEGRSWLISLDRAGVDGAFFSILPGFLFAVLVYLNNNITTLIVNQSDNGLKKDSGLHLDLFVQAVIILLCSFFGFPWPLAVYVESLDHFRSLALLEETMSGPPVVIDVVENRVSPVIVHILITLSLVAAPIIRHIPLAPLWGMLIFVGVQSLSKSQFMDRCRLIITEPALRPPSHYARKVRGKQIIKYTLIQLLVFIVLCAIIFTPVGLVFPVLTVLCIPLRRYVLPKWFEKKELQELDCERTAIGDDEDD